MKNQETEAFIAFGSNVGDRRANLREALEALGAHCRVKAVSPLYSTEPIGYRDQGWFLNGVVKVNTTLEPLEMLARIHAIEQSLGRERRILNGPRTIDLDILLWGSEVIDEPGLTIPHPRAHERLFVVAPWADVAPDLILPAAGKPMAELRRELNDSAQVELYSVPPW